MLRSSLLRSASTLATLGLLVTACTDKAELAGPQPLACGGDTAGSLPDLVGVATITPNKRAWQVVIGLPKDVGPDVTIESVDSVTGGVVSAQSTLPGDSVTLVVVADEGATSLHVELTTSCGQEVGGLVADVAIPTDTGGAPG